jgi:hypothetical protein
MAKESVVFLPLFVLIRKLFARKTPERIADISMMAGKGEGISEERMLSGLPWRREARKNLFGDYS